MFSNLFSPSPQVWTALVAGLIGLPVLIHLINLMRHQKVEWAAMEFLLKSYKKNRNWVWLKQMLLLLSRISVLLLALFMLAQVGCNEERIAALLGNATTHHYVLLDDSFSMSDRSSDGSAFERALSTLSLIGARAENLQNQKFTLLRFSRSQFVAGSEKAALTTIADLNGEVVDSQFAQRLEKIKSGLRVSTLAVDARESLATAGRLIQQRSTENSIVYILSDFRAKDWESSEWIDRQLALIEKSGGATELINCVETERANLVISELGPTGSVRVAGTPLMMRLTVKNTSSFPVEKIQIQLEAHAFKDDSAENQRPEIEEPVVDVLPTIFIDSLPAGESESRDFPVLFNTTGQHAIKAALRSDAIQIDNTHWNVTAFSSTSRILIIDDSEQKKGRFLALAINPGGMTGLSPEFQTADYLRDATVNQLREYDVIYLLDIPRLDDGAIDNLESYAVSGGGVGFFVGPETDVEFYTRRLYRKGAGLFPLPLEKSVEIPELNENRIPDIAPADHSIFPPGMKNPLLDLVQVKRIIQPPFDWTHNMSDHSTVAATVRGIESWPLIVFQQFGQGNIMAILSTAEPLWNNWSRNGTFPPLMLLIEDQLAKGRFQQTGQIVGNPIRVSADPKEFGPDIVFVFPAVNATEDSVDRRTSAERTLPISDAASEFEFELGAADDSDPLTSVNTPGIYDVWLEKKSSQWVARRFALNVDSRESEMALVNQQSFLASLEESTPSFTNWNQFDPALHQPSSSPVTKLLLFCLIGLLVIEPLLAYSASYHAKIRVSSRESKRFGATQLGSTSRNHQ